MNRTSWPLTAVACLLSLWALAACEWGDAESVEAEGQAVVAEREPEVATDYEVILDNAVTDTLRGSARFGRVLDPATGLEAFVVELTTGFDFAGGVFIAHGGATPPTPGTHQVVAVPDSLRPIELQGYSVVYRQGMQRALTSESGTVTFELVTDTLIVGTVDAMLRGLVVIQSQRQRDARIHVRGRFEAHSGNPGYIIGL